jgi:hypothetical protein
VICAKQEKGSLLTVVCRRFPTLYEEVVARRLALGTDEWACVIILLEAFYEVRKVEMRGLRTDI